MGKGTDKGRYICKVGFYDIYAKDSMKTSKERGAKPQVVSTEYNKDLAVAKATEMMEKHLVKA
jgi:hypothetical protein